MTEKVLITTIDNRGVARVTMNRPALRNAFNEELIAEICEAMGRCNADPNVRIIVLTGAGSAFSAGADLNMMKRVAEYSPTENRDDARRLGHMLCSIYSSPKPTIALVNGPAMGGGLGLLAACDIAIASSDAFFALSEVRVGLIPAVISPFVVQSLGVRQARRLFLTGERFTAEKALAIELIHEVTPPEKLNESLEAVIADLLKGAPQAQTESKDLIRSVMYAPVRDALIDDTATRIAGRRSSPEGKEGVTAFLEKRKPSWIE